MKMNKISAIVFVITFLTTAFTGVNKSSANGVAAGIEFDLLSNILTNNHIPL